MVDVELLVTVAVAEGVVVALATVALLVVDVVSPEEVSFETRKPGLAFSPFGNGGVAPAAAMRKTHSSVIESSEGGISTVQGKLPALVISTPARFGEIVKCSTLGDCGCNRRTSNQVSKYVIIPVFDPETHRCRVCINS